MTTTEAQKYVTLGDVTPGRATVTGIYRTEASAERHRNPSEMVARYLPGMARGLRVRHGHPAIGGGVHCDTVSL